MEELLSRHYALWKNRMNYLDLPQEFDCRCPPLMVLGGKRIPDGASPLVLVSLEPLIDQRHYQQQAAFAGASVENHRRWNLDYFDVFPRPCIAGRDPQPYWRVLCDFVAGYCGAGSEAFDWNIFACNYMELPTIPMHAGAHPNVEMAQFRSLLEDRVALLMHRWPTMTLMALGVPTLKALGLRREQGEPAFVLPDENPGNLARYGAIWRAPIFRFNLQLNGGVVPLYWRYVFANGYQAGREGRRLLGERLREVATTSSPRHRNVHPDLQPRPHAGLVAKRRDRETNLRCLFD